MEVNSQIDRTHERRLSLYEARYVALGGLIACFVISLAAFIVLIISTDVGFAFLMFFLLDIVLTLWAFAFFWLYISAIMQMRSKMGIAKYGSMQKVCVLDENIIISVILTDEELEKISDEDEAGYEVMLEWDNIKSARETKEEFFVNTKSFKSIRLPKKGQNIDDLNAIAELLEAKLAKKFKKLCKNTQENCVDSNKTNADITNSDTESKN